jgi:hypothetical protein
LLLCCSSCDNYFSVLNHCRFSLQVHVIIPCICDPVLVVFLPPHARGDLNLMQCNQPNKLSCI